MNDFTKNKYPLFLAPAVTGGILLCLFGIFEVWPLGPNTIAWADMNQQVVPLLLQMKDILSEGDSFFYSLKNAGGMNFWGVFLFFLSSPFSFFVVFVPKTMMWSFANLLVVLKLMTCALTAALFLLKTMPALSGARKTALAVSYGLCGYGLLFYQNLVWLDMMYLFPLLCLALYHLAISGKIAPYTICLTATIFVNFYLSYMVILFILLASWLYLQIFHPSTWRISVLRLGTASILALMFSSVAWLPAFLSYLRSGRGDPIWQSLKGGEFFSHIYTNLPLLFCSVGILAVVILLFKELGNPVVRTGGILFLLLLLPVVIEPINKMWHTGSYQAFPLRYGYMTVFVGLVLMGFFLSDSCKSHTLQSPLSTPGGVAILTLWSAAIGGLGFWLLLGELDALDAYATSLWGDRESFLLMLPFALLLFGMWGVLFWLHRGRLLPQRVITTFVCICVLMQGAFFTTIYMMTPIRIMDTPIEILDLEGRIDDESLYRVKAQEKRFDINMIGAAGYNTFAHYTSLTDQTTMFAQKKLGYSSYWMELSSNGGTMLSDALLGIKYSIYHINNLTEDANTVYKNSTFALVEAEGTLPLATVIEGENADDISQIHSLNRLENQKQIAQIYFGDRQDLFYSYTPNTSDTVVSTSTTQGILQIHPLMGQDGESTLEYNIYIAEEQLLYLDCFGALSNDLGESYYKALEVWVNDRKISDDYPNQGQNGLLCLGKFRDEPVSVKLIVKKSFEVASFGVFGIDVADTLHALSQVKTAEITQGSPHSFDISATASQGEVLMLTMPYDPGFTATLNGDPVQILTVLDGFMAIPLNVGINEISLSYTPPGIWWSVGILGIATVGAVVIAVWQRRTGKLWAPMVLQKAAPIAFGASVVCLLLAVYILPVIIWVSGQI